MVLRWRAGDGPTLNSGLVALWFYRGSGPKLLRNPIFFCDFAGGGGRIPSPTGSAHDHAGDCCLNNGNVNATLKIPIKDFLSKQFY